MEVLLFAGCSFLQICRPFFTRRRHPTEGVVKAGQHRTHPMKAPFLAIHWLALCLTAGAADSVRLRDVTAIPTFERGRNFAYLLIADGNAVIRFCWSSELSNEDEGRKPHHHYPVTLAEDSRYVFTIEDWAYSYGEEADWAEGFHLDSQTQKPTLDRLVRISRKGKVLFDREVCEIHHRKMERIDVPIRYGYIIKEGKEPTFEQLQTRFPHYKDVILGGCCGVPGRTTLRFVCPDCKAAHKKWEKTASPTKK